MNTKTSIPTDALKQFRMRVKGDVVLPQSTNYDETRTLHNLVHDKRPAIIVQASDASDVARSIEFARAQGLEIAVRSGGHSFPGHSMNNDGLVIDISRMLGRINERIEALYDRDHTIGHAYFTPLAGVPDGPTRFAALSEIFRHRLLPLLEEYFFEDWQKIRLVLADNQKPVGARFVVVREDQEGDLAGLFGAEHGLDSYTTKRRYALSDEAFVTPAAFVGIYELDV